MKVYEGDEWKYAKEPTAGGAMSRMAAQVHADNLYGTRRIDHNKWLEITNKIGEPMTERYETLFTGIAI